VSRIGRYVKPHKHSDPGSLKAQKWLCWLRTYQFWYVYFPLWNYFLCYKLFSAFRNAAFWAVRPHILRNNKIFARICLSNYTASHSTELSNSRPLWNKKYHSCLHLFIHSFSSLSYDRSKASSKASSPHSAIQSFLFQMRVSSPFLKVIH